LVFIIRRLRRDEHCLKCGYDAFRFTGRDLCSECGAPRIEWSAFRRRLRKRARRLSGTLVLLSMAIGWTFWRGDLVRRNGWYAMAPDMVSVFFARWAPAQSSFGHALLNILSAHDDDDLTMRFFTAWVLRNESPPTITVTPAAHVLRNEPLYVDIDVPPTLNGWWQLHDNEFRVQNPANGSTAVAKRAGWKVYRGCYLGLAPATLPRLFTASVQLGSGGDIPFTVEHFVTVGGRRILMSSTTKTHTVTMHDQLDDAFTPVFLADAGLTAPENMFVALKPERSDPNWARYANSSIRVLIPKIPPVLAGVHWSGRYEIFANGASLANGEFNVDSENMSASSVEFYIPVQNAIKQGDTDVRLVLSPWKEGVLMDTHCTSYWADTMEFSLK
ncbi:MAG: hypothetical protein KC983_04945, partial [Phycisphaerales bacterium]|nr:hypothetical protein [Phycisphaerales bacterium]